MSIRQTILRSVAKLGAWHAQQQRRVFFAAHQRTAETQQEFLLALIAQHADTAFGRDHGFGKIRTYEDYTAAVPIAGYEHVEPYMQRVMQGETSALLPADQEPLMFSMTSGTTGKPKHIPVTPRFLASIRRGWNIFGVHILSQHPDAWIRPIVQISSSPCEETSPTGKPCGAISGLLAASQKKIVQRLYVVPPWIAQIQNPTTRYYTILRHSIDRDVAFITTANPSSTIKLIETGQDHIEQLLRDLRDGTFTPPGELPPDATPRTFRRKPRFARHLDACVQRDGCFLPTQVWNLSFLTNWTGGTLKLYLNHLRSLFPGVPIHDIGLLASEGRFSIPLDPDTPSGVAEITGNFLEFIPAEERDSDSPTVYRAHQLDVGQDYFLVISNQAGLFRYNLDDRIRVTGHLDQTPIFEFLTRGKNTASITGEKITEWQVTTAMQTAREKTGIPIERFLLQGHFHASETPYYELRFESDDPAKADALAQAFEKALAALNMEYDAKRSGDRLGATRVTRLEPGAMDRYEREKLLARKGRFEQYKHQYLLTEILHDES